MLFLDRASPLGKLERTSQGGYVADAKIARTGTMLYSAKAWRDKGVDVPAKFADSDLLRAYNPPAVLAAAADSLRNAPVTNEHPPELITPKNYRKYSAGIVSADSVTFDGTFLSAKLTLQDEDLILVIDGGVAREVSAGYMSTFRFEDGVTPEGDTYHVIRTGIVYNHAAVVRAGRAGAQVCLALDALESVDATPAEETIPMLFTIDGAEVAADQAQAAFDSQAAKLKAELDAAALKAEAVKSENDSLKAELDAAKAALAVAQSKESVDAAVAAELAARDLAAKAADRKAKVAARYPKLSLDGKSQESIDSLFEAMSSEDVADQDGADRLSPAVTITKGPEADAKPSAPKPLRGRQAMLASYREPGSAEG
jgi:hypothetical protein